MDQPDLTPSECCQYCPYFQEVKAVCNHELRQTLRQAFSEHPQQPCPVFREEKTDAMQTLLEEIEP